MTAAQLKATTSESVTGRLNSPIVGSSWGTSTEALLPSVLPAEVLESMPRPDPSGLVLDARQPSTTSPANDVSMATRGSSDILERAIDLVGPAIGREAARRPSFVALQEWEGVVTHLLRDGFIAKLVDQTQKGNALDEEAEFPNSEISEDDLPLVRLGAIFRWSIGYLRFGGGTKQRASQVVFRRLPQWTRADIESADALASRLAHFFETKQSGDGSMDNQAKDEARFSG